MENHLAARLRDASLGRESAVFAQRPRGEPVTYGELWQNAAKNAGALLSAGVRPGDRVAIQADKSMEMLELVLGTIIAGAAILPLNTAYTAAELDHFLNDAKPTFFFTDPLRVDDLRTVAARAGIENVSAIGEGAAWSDAVSGAFPADPTPRGPEDLAAILYTSGTTGRSKGAMLSHLALASNAETLVESWRFTKDDILIHALPIFHTHGLFVATNVALVAGCSMVFLPKFDADAILAAMPTATAMMGVPTFYTRLLDHPGLTPAAAANMRLFVSGSAPLLAETHARWKERTGHVILERYGMTETNMNTSNPYDGERRGGTVGMALPGIEVRVADEHGTPVAAGTIGTVEVKGPNLFSGYWQMPEKTAEEMRPDGFFITGDLGVYSDDGYLTLVGRGKDLIISGGFNVYPKEVEEKIDAMDGVAESAVIGLPHKDFGEAVAAVVVPEKGASVTETAIVNALAADLARFKQPKRVFFVEELPRNTMGKVQKATLRERYRETFADPASA